MVHRGFQHTALKIGFVKQGTTCILQEDKLRAVSYIASVYIHGNQVTSESEFMIEVRVM
jgi:hypothetical protein